MLLLFYFLQSLNLITSISEKMLALYRLILFIAQGTSHTFSIAPTLSAMNVSIFGRAGCLQSAVIQQCNVNTGKSGWWTAPTLQRDEWKCVTMESGAQSAMTPGEVQMLKWSANNWGLSMTVS